MFETAELMSISPSGDVTFPAFSRLPPILALFGTNAEDLNIGYLSYCWGQGSSGRQFVDRVGFGIVWNLVQGKLVYSILPRRIVFFTAMLQYHKQITSTRTLWSWLG